MDWHLACTATSLCQDKCCDLAITINRIWTKTTWEGNTALFSVSCMGRQRIWQVPFSEGGLCSSRDFMRNCGMTFSPEILNALPRFVPIRATQKVGTVLKNLSLNLIILNWFIPFSSWFFAQKPTKAYAWSLLNTGNIARSGKKQTQIFCLWNLCQYTPWTGFSEVTVLFNIQTRQ